MNKLTKASKKVFKSYAILVEGGILLTTHSKNDISLFNSVQHASQYEYLYPSDKIVEVEVKIKKIIG